MDDFPAGPASREARRPQLSVVIPVRDGGRHLGRALRALRDSADPDIELIVVDDGSVDDSAEVAATFGAVVLRHDRPLGPSAARNAGAGAATAPLLFFLDADVVVHADTIRRAMARFEDDDGVTALFGSYDDDPPAPGLVSRFRNLLHHYVHQSGTFVGDVRPAHTFWTGCGMIRREAFLQLGGFDPERYRRPAIEDIEFGYRLSRSGHRVLLARDVQAAHLKRWTLGSVIVTDVFRRGVPWMLLMLRSGNVENDLNLDRSQKWSVAAVGLGILGLVASTFFPAAILVSMIGLAIQVFLNRRFYRFLAARRGIAFAVGSIPLHTLYFCCCGASVALALAIWRFPGREARRRSDGRAARGRVDSATTAVRQPTATRTGRRLPWKP